MKIKNLAKRNKILMKIDLNNNKEIKDLPLENENNKILIK